MVEAAVRKSNVKMLRDACVWNGVLGLIAAVATIVIRFCYAEEAYIWDPIKCGGTVLFAAFLTLVPLLGLRALLFIRRITLVSPLAVSIAIHYVTTVFYTVVPVVALFAVRYGQEAWFMETSRGSRSLFPQFAWCSPIFSCFFPLAGVIEHRGDAARFQDIQRSVNKFAIGHVFFELVVLAGSQILFNDVEFILQYNVFAIMTIFTWFNTRAACMGYGKKLFLSPIFYAALFAAAVGQVLFIHLHWRRWSAQPFIWWGLSIGVAAPILVLGFIINFIPPKSTSSSATESNSVRYQAASSA